MLMVMHKCNGGYVSPGTNTASQAFANVLKRMLEASGRGMWKADDATLQKLRDMYEDMDAQLEGIR